MKSYTVGVALLLSLVVAVCTGQGPTKKTTLMPTPPTTPRVIFPTQATTSGPTNAQTTQAAAITTSPGGTTQAPGGGTAILSSTFNVYLLTTFTLMAAYLGTRV